MIDTKEFVDGLIQQGYSEFIGVPCSNLKYIINYTINLGIYRRATNEGDAVAYAVGKALSGKKVAILLQNSGLTNAMSPISSLSYIYRIPLLFIVGNRGVGKDEPQHELMGKITPDLLQMSSIGVVNIEESGLSNYITYADKNRKSLAILINKGVMSEIKLNDYEDRIGVPTPYALTRSQIVDIVFQRIKSSDIVVSSTGFISRAIYDKYDRDGNFYMVGSMGCAISLATGLADANPDRLVYCFDGDGAFLMRPEGLILFNEIHPNNLIHLILDNGTYESTGSQHTSAYTNDIYPYVHSLYNGDSSDKVIVNVAESEDSLNRYLDEVLDSSAYDFTKCIIVVENNDNTDNYTLGRPKETSVELGNRFINFLKENK